MTLVHPCGDVHDISVIYVTSLHKCVHGHLSRRGKMLRENWLYKCSHDRLLNDKSIMIAYG